jgi:hypothetical protein
MGRELQLKGLLPYLARSLLLVVDWEESSVTAGRDLITADQGVLEEVVVAPMRLLLVL